MCKWCRGLQASPDKELCAAIFTLQTDNDQLRQEVVEAKKSEEKLKSELAEVRFTARLVDQQSEELSNYIAKTTSGSTAYRNITPASLGKLRPQRSVRRRS